LTAHSQQMIDETVYVEMETLLENHLTGIGRFVARMVEAFGRRGPVRLFSPSSMTEINITPSEMASLGSIDSDVSVWTKKLVDLPKRDFDAAAATQSIAVYPLFRPLQRMFRKEIGVFYDFTPMLLPWTHAPETVQHFAAHFGVASPLFDAVVAISESTRYDAKWLSAIEHERVVTAYPGPSLCNHSHCYEIHSHESKHPREIILVVSTLEPRKNARFLIDWFLNTSAIDESTELWWVGGKGWWTADADILALQAAAAKSRRVVRFLGTVPDTEICRLYRTSMVSIYPSLYEGFGFPVLDSLLHDTPVLASCNSSLAEFTTGGIFYFDPYDDRSLEEAYRSFLKQRGSLAIDGATLRSKYSWDNLANTIFQLAV
jgi:glycosyltransferase involved in cell wall biosynthesis